MCDFDPSLSPVKPEDKLAALMRADLGTTCTPREIRMFIKANWRAVTAYAHAIHEADQSTPRVEK